MEQPSAARAPPPGGGACGHVDVLGASLRGPAPPHGRAGREPHLVAEPPVAPCSSVLRPGVNTESSLREEIGKNPFDGKGSVTLTSYLGNGAIEYTQKHCSGNLSLGDRGPVFTRSVRSVCSAPAGGSCGGNDDEEDPVSALVVLTLRDGRTRKHVEPA